MYIRDARARALIDIKDVRRFIRFNESTAGREGEREEQLNGGGSRRGMLHMRDITRKLN